MRHATSAINSGKQLQWESRQIQLVSTFATLINLRFFDFTDFSVWKLRLKMFLAFLLNSSSCFQVFDIAATYKTFDQSRSSDRGCITSNFTAHLTAKRLESIQHLIATLCDVTQPSHRQYLLNWINPPWLSTTEWAETIQSCTAINPKWKTKAKSPFARSGFVHTLKRTRICVWFKCHLLSKCGSFSFEATRNVY